MSGYRFTPQAARDLVDIWSFIAQDNPDAADRVEAAVFRACNHLIVYDPESKPLHVIRILHGARNLPLVLT